MTTPAREVTFDDRKPHPGRKLTWEEFLDWVDEDTPAEWVDGEVELMASPFTLPHQELIFALHVKLREHVTPTGLGTVAGPFFIHFRNAPRGREPDLVFFRTERNSQLRRWFIESPVDLVVEVISPESVRRDRAVKLLEYEREGILEYWLFDPLTRTPEFYRLGPDGRYQATYPVDGTYTSEAVPAFQLDVAELFATLDRLPPFGD